MERGRSAPTVTVSPHSSIDIHVDGRGTYQLQPVQEVIASVRDNCLQVAGYLTSANGEVLGPAFAIDPNHMVTTQRTLAFAHQQGQHAAEGIDIQLMNGGRVPARLAAGLAQLTKIYRWPMNWQCLNCKLLHTSSLR